MTDDDAKSFLKPFHEHVALPRKTPQGMGIPAYGMTEDFRPRHVLIPPRDLRMIGTMQKLQLPSNTELLIFTPPHLLMQKILICTYYREPDTGELFLAATSFRVDSFYLKHGDLIAAVRLVTGAFNRGS